MKSLTDIFRAETTPPPVTVDKEEKIKPHYINLSAANEPMVRKSLLKSLGYGPSLIMERAYTYTEGADGNKIKLNDGYFIFTDHETHSEIIKDDDWGILKVQSKLSEFTYQQWMKILFGFTSDKKRERERLEKISAFGYFILDRPDFIDSGILNYKELKMEEDFNPKSEKVKVLN